MGDVGVPAMTHETFRRFLADRLHPWELTLHAEDFRRLRMMLGAPPPFYDETGPYLWYETTKVRPAKGFPVKVDVSAAPQFIEDGVALGWR